MNLQDLASRTPFDCGPLPPWFKRPRRGDMRQGYLFPEARNSVLAEIRVSLEDAASWHDRGWLAFDPRRVEELDPDQVGALIFVRNVARSGMSLAQLDALFGKLPPKCLPDPERLSYSFTFGWVESASPDPFKVIAEHLEDWLEFLAEEEDVDTLESLAALVDERLQDMPDSSDDAEEPDG